MAPKIPTLQKAILIDGPTTRLSMVVVAIKHTMGLGLTSLLPMGSIIIPPGVSSINFAPGDIDLRKENWVMHMRYVVLSMSEISVKGKADMTD